MSTVEEMEQPAKRWQVQKINDKVSAIDQKLDTVLNKLDANVTHTQLEEQIKDAKEYTDNKISLALSDILPTIKALKKFTWLIIPVVIGLIIDAVLKSWSK